jgi:hypothetical protein
VSTGDPAVAFDADGTAYHTTLGNPISQAISPEPSEDLLVSHSSDGGQTWSVPSCVAQGVDSHVSATKAWEDKGYITAWGSGNALGAWTNIILSPQGSLSKLLIYDAVTHDRGVTWSTPTAISGSAGFCVGASGDDACDINEAAVPVYSGGHVYVVVDNFSNASDGHYQYLVAEVSPPEAVLRCREEDRMVYRRSIQTCNGSVNRPKSHRGQCDFLQAFVAFPSEV